MAAFIGKKVLYFLAGTVPTTPEATAIARLSMDHNIVVGVRSVLFADNSSPSLPNSGVVQELETCDGVAGSFPTVGGGFANSYDALISAQTVKDYSAEAAGGPEALSVFAPAGASFVHTATTQLAAVAENPDGTLADVTTACTWASGTPGTATVGASTGLLTGVAAGTTVITATYTVNGKTVTATKTMTAT